MSALLLGCGLGLALCAAPGPVMLLTFRLGLQRGFRPAWAVQLGSCVGAITWGVLGLTGLMLLADSPWARIGLGAIGTALLLGLAWGSVRTALTGTRVCPQAGAGDAHCRRIFASAAGVSLANPLELVFWLAVGAGLQEQGLNPHAPVQLLLFLASFLAATVALGTGLALLASAGRRFVGPPLSRAIGLAAGVALGGFAGYLAVGAAHLAFSA